MPIFLEGIFDKSLIPHIWGIKIVRYADYVQQIIVLYHLRLLKPLKKLMVNNNNMLYYLFWGLVKLGDVLF